jgi:tetratricopeptide (TPR) repeat protein
MAPEQSKGDAIDARADIYAFGLILYEMLIGPRIVPPGTVQDRIDAMRQRVEQGPPPLRSVDESVPPAVDALVTRCLERDPAARFQTSSELAAALGQLDDEGEPIPEPRRLSRRQMAAAVAAVVAMLAGTFYLARPALEVKHEPVSVLVADFDNKTNDPVFQSSLEQALGIGVEGASFITAYSRTAAQRLVAEMRPGARLDESMARLISGREGIKVILAGTIEPKGSGYSITVRAVDPANGQTLTTAKGSASDRSGVLKSVGSLASRIRGALGDTTPESAKRAAIETFTAGSLEAAGDFSVGQDLASAGKDDEALAYYKRALDRDPRFGRAYASWGVSAYKLGRRDESAEAYKKALSLLDRMTEREKYRTLGTYYLTTARNYEKAVENYTTLVQLYPADRAGHSNLALAYFYVLDFKKALDEGRRAVDIYPRNETFRNNVALYAMYAGDFETAAREASRVVEQNPRFAKAYLPLAVAALANGDTAAARKAYERMSPTGPFGESLASIGTADVAMYEQRFRDAETTLVAGIASDEQTKNTVAMTAKLLALADVYAQTGKMNSALETAQRAVKLGQDEAVIVPAARLFLKANKLGDAQALADTLGQQLQPQRRAYAKVLQGEIALKQQRTFDAVEAFQAAQKMADVWLGRFDLGVAYVEAGHYAEALPELELAQKRRGEATAIFLDDIPSFRYLATLPYWLGRAQEGLGMGPAATANYKTFLAHRSSATDPLTADARRRIGP